MLYGAEITLILIFILFLKGYVKLVAIYISI